MSTPTTNGPSAGHVWHSRENLLNIPKNRFVINKMEPVAWTQKNIAANKIPQNMANFEIDKDSYFLFDNHNDPDFQKDPTKRRYIAGWREHVASLDNDWWEANKANIEANVDLANPKYRTELGEKWNLDKYKEALTDGKLGPIHRMHVASIVGFKPQGSSVSKEVPSVEEKMPPVEPPVIEEDPPGHKLVLTDYNLPRKLAADENARRTLFAKLSSPVGKASYLPPPQKRFEHRGISKDVTDAQANVYKAATQGSADNSQFSKLLSVQNNISDATLKHDAGQHQLIDKSRQLYDQRLDAYKTNSQSIDNTNQKYLHAKLSGDVASKAAYQDTIGRNMQAYIQGLEHNEKVARQDKLMFEYEKDTRKATKYQDILNRVTSDPYKVQFIENYKKNNPEVEHTPEQIEEAFKSYQNEAIKSLGFGSMEELQTKIGTLRELIGQRAAYLTSLPGKVEIEKRGGILSMLKKGGKHPDVSRYEAQVKQSIKTVEQLYKLFEAENNRVSKGLAQLEKEFAKQLKIK
jgi:hypothetical protein